MLAACHKVTLGVESESWDVTQGPAKEQKLSLGLLFLLASEG